MKLVIERAALLRAVNHVQGVVERRTTIPILSNMLMTTSEGQLSLASTDLDLEITERVAAQIEIEGRTTVPAHTLYDIVRKLREGAQIEVEAVAERNELVLRSGRSTFTLACLPPEDYPVMTAGELPHQFALSASELRTLIDRTRFAISTEETRYYLNGIYLHAGDNDGATQKVLRAVATDGHRLARVEMMLPPGAAAIKGVIIPRKTVIELRKLLDGNDEVMIAIGDAKIRFDVGGVRLVSKLIDGTFPDYARVIPIANDRVLQVAAKAYAEAIDRVSTIATDHGRGVKLQITKDSLVASTTSPENGTAVEEIEARYTGPDLEIGFNARYMRDITALIEKNLEIVLSDAAAPAIFRAADDKTALYVLMPMRV